jgi:hypothetical protein
MPQRTDILGVVSISISRHELAVSVGSEGKGGETPRKIKLSEVVSVSLLLGTQGEHDAHQQQEIQKAAHGG